MAVVSVSMERGALSKEVAETLARELGATLAHTEMVDGLARHMRMPRNLIVDLISARAPGLDHQGHAERDLRIFTGAEILAAAARGGAIIRGWGAAHLFEAVDCVVNVRICAPLERRVLNVMNSVGTEDRQRALREIRRSDASYAARLHGDAEYGADSHPYHVVLNTERCPVDQCVEQIVALLRDPRFRPTAATRGALHDMAIAAAVQAALRRSAATSEADIVVHANAGVVRSPAS